MGVLSRVKKFLKNKLERKKKISLKDNISEKQSKDLITSLVNEFAVDEYLVHHYAYNNSKNGNVVIDQYFVDLPVFIDGEVSVQKFKHMDIVTQNEYLKGFISSSTYEPRLNVLWRGTDTSSLGSILLNIEKDGATNETWEKEQVNVIKQINSALKQAKTDFPGEKIKLVIGGHSQGAATSQHTLMTILSIAVRKELEKKETLSVSDLEIGNVVTKYAKPELLDGLCQYIDLDTIGDIELISNCGTGVSKEKQENFNKILNWLKENKKQKPKIKLINRDGDAVTQTGQAQFGFGLSKEQADVVFFKGHTGFKGLTKKLMKLGSLVSAMFGFGITGSIIGGLLGGAISTKFAHCNKHLAEGLYDYTHSYQSYDIMINDTDKGKKLIDESIGKKHWLPNFALKGYHKFRSNNKKFKIS